MNRCLLVVMLVCGATAGAWTQSRDGSRTEAQTGTAQITGRVVVASETPTPLRRVVVTLTGDQPGIRLVAVTDDSGAYTFVGLAAGRYSLVAAKAGYVPMAFGGKRPGGAGTPVLVREGQRAVADVALPKGSVLSGTVRDEFGRPVPGAGVTALVFRMSSQTGELTPQSVAAGLGSAGQVVSGYFPDAFPGTAVTDDRGEYRIYGLAAGDYIVSATTRAPGGNPTVATDVHQTSDADVRRAQQLLRAPGGAVPSATTAGATEAAPVQRVDFVPVYHPSAISRSDAATIALGVGEERYGVDVSLRLVSTARVYGDVIGPDGAPVAGVQVAVMDPLSTSGGVFRTIRSGPDGEYAIGAVPPGRYLVQASAYPSGDSAAVEVTINGVDVHVPISLMPALTVPARIVFDGATPPPSVEAVRLILWRRPQPIFGGHGLEYQSEGRVQLTRVPHGTYTLRLNGRAPAGWILRSAMLNGVDVSDVPFELRPGVPAGEVVITLTDRPAEVSGTLQTSTGEPAPGYVLLVFSANKSYWVPGTRRTQLVRPDASGRFVARDLPAGDYLIAAVTDLEDGQWHNAAFLAELAASGPIAFTLAEGDRKVQDIRIR